MDAFAATRLVVGLAFLLFGAVSDLRTRTVRNPVWIVLGMSGFLLLALELALSQSDLTRYALLLATAILFAAVFFGEPLLDEDGFHLRPLRLAAFSGAAALLLGSAYVAFSPGYTGMTDYAELLAMPVMVIVFQAFYRMRLLVGGADAKALIALTLLVPTHPDVSPFPILTADPRVAGAMRAVFPFSLVVFVDAAVLFLAVPLAYLVLNAARGDLAFPQAFFGYRAPIRALPKHAWLMERIDEDGEHLLVLFPGRGKDGSEDVERLRAAGVKRVWVQSKVPFIVPLSIGFVLAFFMGNALLALFPR